MRSLETNYPDVAQIENIGYSWEGLPVNAIRVKCNLASFLKKFLYTLYIIKPYSTAAWRGWGGVAPGNKFKGGGGQTDFSTFLMYYMYLILHCITCKTTKIKIKT
jgi:hypothetical protein